MRSIHFDEPGSRDLCEGMERAFHLLGIPRSQSHQRTDKAVESSLVSRLCLLGNGLYRIAELGEGREGIKR